MHTFVALSSVLTGVETVQLFGTGQAEAYLVTLGKILPVALLDDLFKRFEALPAEEIEAAVEHQVLDDTRLGCVAQNIILMWYRGVWRRLPDDWRASFGAFPEDENHLISGAAYQAGLQWEIAGAHPIGARHQGYASWSLVPTKPNRRNTA
ncbi:MAG: hypothetical protein NTAFB01_35560 [Nitrospira sp.]